MLEISLQAPRSQEEMVESYRQWIVDARGLAKKPLPKEWRWRGGFSEPAGEILPTISARIAYRRRGR